MIKALAQKLGERLEGMEDILADVRQDTHKETFEEFKASFDDDVEEA